uniref:Peptidase S54 rhomboid domain-containing protein n=1 Tax=Helicotheca tamesis TaxID=374047 RepID=A0A7S2I7V0_9STRA|mmetsp:Transcript_6365/g.8601  ORF Transcript_6365/g.8601 Transcript_6365/m.8601 type:complete len:354 (+) Transcript_6365:122-1183(+)
MTNPSAPPQPNPVLSAYESFVRDTPLITRYTLTSQFVTWFLSFFVNPVNAISNIPLFTILHFELYRIITSPIVCTSLLSLIFAFISFTTHGKTLEQSLGSAAFGTLILTLSLLTNILYLVIAFTMYFITSSQICLIMPCSGIWIILLGLIAIECSCAPADSKRKLFVVEVPTLYYPLALLGLFTLFGGINFSYVISVGVGYAYGRNKLDFLKVNQNKLNRWEESGCLRNFAGRQGWVKGMAALGGSAWDNLPGGSGSAGGGGSGDGWSPTSFFQGQRTGQSGNDGGGASAASGGGPGEVSKPKDPAAPTFPSGGGRSLGGTTRRGAHPSSETRAAMLEAASRRAQMAEEGRAD